MECKTFDTDYGVVSVRKTDKTTIKICFNPTGEGETCITIWHEDHSVVGDIFDRIDKQAAVELVSSAIKDTTMLN